MCKERYVISYVKSGSGMLLEKIFKRVYSAWADIVVRCVEHGKCSGFEGHYVHPLLYDGYVRDGLTHEKLYPVG
jgi:hypothetical protein